MSQGWRGYREPERYCGADGDLDGVHVSTASPISACVNRMERSTCFFSRRWSLFASVCTNCTRRPPVKGETRPLFRDLTSGRDGSDRFLAYLPKQIRGCTSCSTERRSSLSYASEARLSLRVQWLCCVRRRFSRASDVEGLTRLGVACKPPGGVVFPHHYQ